MNVEKWKNNKFIKNLKIKQYPAYPAEFMVFLCVTLFASYYAFGLFWSVSFLFFFNFFSLINWIKSNTSSKTYEGIPFVSFKVKLLPPEAVACFVSPGRYPVGHRAITIFPLKSTICCCQMVLLRESRNSRSRQFCWPVPLSAYHKRG